MTVQGTLEIDRQIPSFKDATVYISLEDIGRVDADADIIYKEIFRNISHSQGERTLLEFNFHSDESDSSHPRYNLRAHVDVSGNGDVDAGDLVTQQSYPVDPEKSRTHVLKLKKV